MISSTVGLLSVTRGKETRSKVARAYLILLAFARSRLRLLGFVVR